MPETNGQNINGEQKNSKNTLNHLSTHYYIKKMKISTSQYHKVMVLVLQ